MRDTLQINPEDAVKYAWQNASNNDEARDNLLEMMNDDPVLFDAIVGRSIEQAAAAAVAKFRIQERSRIWKRPAQPDSRVSALARITRMSLFDFPLPNGTRLGDASYDDVLQAAEIWQQHADANAAKAAFMRRVADAMKKTKTVRESLTVEKLQELK